MSDGPFEVPPRELLLNYQRRCDELQDLLAQARVELERLRSQEVRVTDERTACARIAEAWLSADHPGARTLDACPGKTARLEVAKAIAQEIRARGKP